MEKLGHRIAEIAARAAMLDATGAFPAEDIALLRNTSLPVAPLPHALGGAGAGTEPAGCATILGLLRALGAGNLAVARLFEAHVNVVRLVTRFGTPAQAALLARRCHEGAFYGLWVTDAPGAALRLDGGVLSGTKSPCSGAGSLRHALVTVQAGDDVRMALLDLTGSEPVVPLGARLLGMRASGNGSVQLDGMPLAPDAMVGAAGDYLREPDFSTGAWRTMAATLGGMDALVAEVRSQLRVRGHHEFPLQQARFGEMLIAQETAALWTRAAADRAEAGVGPAADQVAYVNLARIAVEAACLDLVRGAQRALGLSALMQPNPVERLLRDLMTYLRQPAPDLVLTEAAQHALRP